MSHANKRANSGLNPDDLQRERQKFEEKQRLSHLFLDKSNDLADPANVYR